MNRTTSNRPCALTVWLAALFALASLACSRPVVPSHVRSRVAYGDFNPTGTWLGDDGSTLELTTPEGRNQLFAVRSTGPYGSLAGEALVDGETVYVTRHNARGANDLCLYLYEKRDGHLEAIWGSARGATPIAYEQAHLATPREGDWNGVYNEWGNNRGRVYEDKLIIGRGLEGDARIHRLHWTVPNQGWYRGAAFEFGDRLVGVRLPGVLVHTQSRVWGNYRVTRRSTQVGRGVRWVLGAYRRDGDELVGVETRAGVPELTEVRWRRASAGGHAPVPALAPSDADPQEPTPAVHVPPSEPEAEAEMEEEPEAEAAMEEEPEAEAEMDGEPEPVPSAEGSL